MSDYPAGYLIQAAILAANMSSCQKSQRGAVVFTQGGTIVGTGYNRLPIPSLRCTGLESCRQECSRACVHAEQAAMLDVLDKDYQYEHNLLHVKVRDGELIGGGPPSCPECSKLMVYMGLKDVWLLEIGKGWVRRSAEEFHAETWKNVRKGLK